MAYQISDITNEPFQRHIVLTPDGEITLTIRFYPAVEIWAMDVTYFDRSVYGIRLSASVSLLRDFNFPFDFLVLIADNSGIDPFRVDDFANGRCELYFASRKEMFELRGIEVPNEV